MELPHTKRPHEAAASLRPTSVYANPSCQAGCSCDVLRLLSGRHRVGYRLVMILLSQRSWPPAAIAELLGCDPTTVRRWVHRYNQDGASGGVDRPRPGRPRLGSPGSAPTAAGCWPSPRRGRSTGSTSNRAGPP